VGRLGLRELGARERLGRLVGRAQGAAQARGRQAGGEAAALQADPGQNARLGSRHRCGWSRHCTGTDMAARAGEDGTQHAGVQALERGGWT
jgi:hypothetical protein